MIIKDEIEFFKTASSKLYTFIPVLTDKNHFSTLIIVVSVAKLISQFIIDLDSLGDCTLDLNDPFVQDVINTSNILKKLYTTMVNEYEQN